MNYLLYFIKFNSALQSEYFLFYQVFFLCLFGFCPSHLINDTKKYKEPIIKIDKNAITDTFVFTNSSYIIVSVI